MGALRPFRASGTLGTHGALGTGRAARITLGALGPFRPRWALDTLRSWRALWPGWDGIDEGFQAVELAAHLRGIGRCVFLGKIGVEHGRGGWWGAGFEAFVPRPRGQEWPRYLIGQVRGSKGEVSDLIDWVFTPNDWVADPVDWVFDLVFGVADVVDWVKNVGFEVKHVDFDVGNVVVWVQNLDFGVLDVIFEV